jgi:hypothetical protein
MHLRCGDLLLLTSRRVPGNPGSPDPGRYPGLPDPAGIPALPRNRRKPGRGASTRYARIFGERSGPLPSLNRLLTAALSYRPEQDTT